MTHTPHYFGSIAFYEGYDLYDNPYEEGQDHDDWEIGWKDAEVETWFTYLNSKSDGERIY